MKLLPRNNFKEACSKGLFFILLIAGIFTISYHAAVPNRRPFEQKTKYFHTTTSRVNGFAYPKQLHCNHKRAPVNIIIFAKTNLSLLYTQKVMVSLKVQSHIVLSKAVYLLFSLIKSISQSGKSAPLLIFA